MVTAKDDRLILYYYYNNLLLRENKITKNTLFVWLIDSVPGRVVFPSSVRRIIICCWTTILSFLSTKNPKHDACCVDRSPFLFIFMRAYISSHLLQQQSTQSINWWDTYRLSSCHRTDGTTRKRSRTVILFCKMVMKQCYQISSSISLDDIEMKNFFQINWINDIR